MERYGWYNMYLVAIFSFIHGRGKGRGWGTLISRGDGVLRIRKGKEEYCVITTTGTFWMELLIKLRENASLSAIDCTVFAHIISSSSHTTCIQLHTFIKNNYMYTCINHAILTWCCHFIWARIHRVFITQHRGLG